jgi:protease-4
MSGSKKTEPRRSNRVTWILLGVTFAVFLLFAGSFGALVVYLQRPPTARVADGSFLRIPLSGMISDAPQQGGVFVDPQDQPPTATEIAAAIRKAAKDDRISGVYLEMKGPMMGWALGREIRNALIAFRETGKPCVAYGEIFSTRDYYVASACDQVLIAPSGIPMITGQALTVTYYRDALDYLGVKPRFVHAGDYKTAIEPFERMAPSPQAVESYEFLLDGMWNVVVEEIASSRGMSPEEVMRAIDQISFTPARMVESGLFDGVGYSDAIEANLGSVGDDDWYDKLQAVHQPATKKERKRRFTQIKEYRKNLYGKGKKKIAVVYAEGPILSGKSSGGLFAPDGLFDGDFREWMERVRDDDDVIGVVLRVNSPGGSALAADMMHREIALTKAAGKPVVVSMADYAASGEYMISANADWIIAHPTTITGSIGVFGQFFDASGTYEKLRLAQHVYKRGERADLLSLTSPHDAEDRRVLQQFVDDTYESFVTLVADGRGVAVADVEPVAQGRVWTGTQGVEGRHLVDALGGLDEALAKVRELSGVEEDALLRLPAQKTFFELLMDELSSAQAPTVRIELPFADAAPVLREVELLHAFHAQGGIVAYLPGTPTLR